MWLLRSAPASRTRASKRPAAVSWVFSLWSMYAYTSGFADDFS